MRYCNVRYSFRIHQFLVLVILATLLVNVQSGVAAVHTMVPPGSGANPESGIVEVASIDVDEAEPVTVAKAVTDHPEMPCHEASEPASDHADCGSQCNGSCSDCLALHLFPVDTTYSALSDMPYLRPGFYPVNPDHVFPDNLFRPPNFH